MIVVLLASALTLMAAHRVELWAAKREEAHAPKAAWCDVCGRTFLGSQGVAWHLHAAHPEAAMRLQSDKWNKGTT